MTLQLQAISQPSLGELQINEPWFSIGRAEALFEQFAPDTVTGLMPHHARILREHEWYYLLDAGTGLTTHNDARVECKPVQLHVGDEIGFGEVLRYRVAAINAVPAPPPVGRISLHAVSGGGGGVDAIPINGSPLWISRDVGPFAPFSKAPEHPGHFLSRRHACLYLRQGSLFVEDLGSTNGTTADGCRIAPYTAVALRNGSRVGFCDDTLSFSVRIVVPQTANGTAATLKPTARTEGTVYLNTAESFLDIFCDQEDAPDSEVLDQQAADAGNKPAVRNSRLRRLGMFFRELKSALGGEPGTRRQRWLVAAGLVAIITVGGAVHRYGAEAREIEALYTHGEYNASLRLATAYLREQPQSHQVLRLASEALIQSLVPAWVEQLELGQFAEAQSLSDAAMPYTEANPQAASTLKLLTWIVDLQRFGAERGGFETPFRLFQDEEPMRDLLDRWQADTSDFKAQLVRIGNAVPAFQAMHKQVGSDRRVLQAQRDYLQASSKLREDLLQHLQAGEMDAALARLTVFRQHYPRIAGAEPLATDLTHFQQLREAVAKRDLATLSQLHESRFRTPLVSEQATTWNADQLPSEASMSRFRQAQEAWRTGQVEHAIRLLQARDEGPWGEAAQVQAARFQSIAGEYASLTTAKASADAHYAHRLLALYNRLDSAEDTYFITALDGQASELRGSVLTEADTLYQQVTELWSAYRANGGINGLLRLEREVSEGFREQARRLMSGTLKLARAAELERLAGRQSLAEQRQLHDDLHTEASRQRLWLSDLGLVLEPALLEAKLRLLPAAQETNRQIQVGAAASPIGSQVAVIARRTGD